jgi:two-component system sensor histidine kinase DesK
MEPGLWAGGYDLGGRPAPRLATALAWIVFTCLFLLTAFYLLASRLELWQRWVTIASSAVLLVFQLVLASRKAVRFRQTRLGYAILPVHAALGFAPMLLFHDEYVGLPHFALGSTLLILKPRWNWLGFGLGVLAMGIAPFFDPEPYVNMIYAVASSVISGIVTGLVVYGLTTMASVVQAMDTARTEMAKMAVAAERLRFARDLHDLLGYSLSAISLKSELTHRLVAKNPVRAQEELTQIIEISRQALADVRSVASGYRELSLEEEAVSARSVLSAAEVEVRMDIDLDQEELPARIRTVLATMLREGVTNILRHSKAERCEVNMRQHDSIVEIEITNDGVPQPPEKPNPDSGSGIQNLSNRVANLDGRLTAGLGPDGRYRLRATIPTSRQDTDAPTAAA